MSSANGAVAEATATDRRIARVFARHDGDGSGTLDPDELRPALACLGVFVGKVT